MSAAVFRPTLHSPAVYCSSSKPCLKLCIQGLTLQSCRNFALNDEEFVLSPETLSPDADLISGRLFREEPEQGARLKPRDVCSVTEPCSRADRAGYRCRQRVLMKCVKGQCKRKKALSEKRACACPVTGKLQVPPSLAH